MAKQSLLVLDDFYDDPHSIREMALGLTFRRDENTTYPGAEGRANHIDWNSVRLRLLEYLPEGFDYPCPKDPIFPQGLFRLALSPDELTRRDRVHQDRQSWSAVIYLSRPEDCVGGVAFYRHRQTGAYAATPEWEEAVFGDILDPLTEEGLEKVREHFVDMSNWEEVQRVAMRFNRAVLLMAHCFHGSIGVFGDVADQGRLTQHFEFYGMDD